MGRRAGEHKHILVQLESRKFYNNSSSAAQSDDNKAPLYLCLYLNWGQVPEVIVFLK